MSVENTTALAAHIAQKLEEIKELLRKRTLAQNRLEQLKVETSSAVEELNRIEGNIRSVKYEITDGLLDTSTELRLVTGK